MGVTKFTHIPSHPQWVKARNEAGGKSGMSKKVNVGKLLDTYHKAGKTVSARAAALKTLREGLTHYTADAAVKKVKDVHDTAMSIFNVIKNEELALKTNKDLGLQIGLLVADGYKRLAKVKAEMDANKIDEAGNTYEKFYDGIGRGVGQKLADGTLRQAWTKAHTTLPTRENISACKGDTGKIKKLLVVGIPGYKKALDALLAGAQKEGLDVKLG